MARCIECGEEYSYVCYWCLSRKIRSLDERIKRLEGQLTELLRLIEARGALPLARPV